MERSGNHMVGDSVSHNVDISAKRDHLFPFYIVDEGSFRIDIWSHILGAKSEVIEHDKLS
jgi:hypothetical protein